MTNFIEQLNMRREAAKKLILDAAEKFRYPHSLKITHGRLCFVPELEDYAAFLHLSAVNVNGTRVNGRFMIYRHLGEVIVSNIEKAVNEKLAMLMTAPNEIPDFDVAEINALIKKRFLT